MAQFRNPRIKFGTTSNSIYLDTSEQNKLVLKNNDLDIVQFSGITTNSTIKIQSTDPKLELFNYSSNPYTEISLGSTGKDDWKILSGYKDGTDTDGNFHIKRANKEFISINTTGVGINVTNPQYPLEVSGTATFRNRVNVQGSLVLGGGNDTEGTAPLIWKIGISDINYYTIPPGNVGIGISDPNFKLEVNGDFGISGSININKDSVYNIGTTDKKFNNLYINNINISGSTISYQNDNININDNTRINGNLNVEGDLNVFGNAVTFDTETIQVEDSMIALANNNTSDIIDNGFYSQFYSGVTKYSGLIRDASDGIYKLFTNLELEPQSTIDINHSSFEYADISLKNINVNNDINVSGNIYSNGQIISPGSLWQENSNDIYFNTGNVGIGITTPINGKVHISGDFGSVSLTNDSYGELTSTGAGFGDTATNSYSLYADGKIAASEFNAVSDIRTKNILSNRDINKDIDFIEKINIYDYEFIDKYNYSNNKKIGFMAQEIYELNESIINKSKKFIPNIFNTFCFNYDNIIHIPDNTHDLFVDDILKIEVKLKNGILKQLTVKILEKKHDNIKIDLCCPNIDYNHPLFIYGKLVNDFMTIDINQLLSMNTNLIKHLLHKNNSLEDRMQEIEDKLNKI